MITKQLARLIFLFLLTAALMAAEPDPNIPLVGPGNPSLRTENLQFPRAMYYVRVKNQTGDWVTRGTFTEQGKSEEEKGLAIVKRSQVQTFTDGKSYISHVAAFEKKSLIPIASKRETRLPQYPGGFVKSFNLTYGDGKLEGTWEKEGSGESDFPAKMLDQPMFEGDVLGVILAALPLKKGYKARLPVMYSQMGLIYTVVARVVGQKDFKTASGEKVRAWTVETDWHDLASGDVSPGGGSGGTYYVVPNPPAGYPHVPKYVNDSFDTEVLAQMLDTKSK